MILYSALLAVTLLFSFFSNNKKLNKFLYIAICAILILLVGLRKDTVGNDSANYAYFYSDYGKLSLSQLSSNSRFEIGYLFYSWLLYQINPNYYFLFLVTAVISLVPVFVVMYKMSDNPIYSIFIFLCFRYYFSYMNVLRQGIAFAFIFVAVYLLCKKKIIIPILLIVLSSFFHVAAILALIIVPIRWLKINKKNTIILLITSIVLFFGFEYLISFMFKIFPQFSHYINSEFFAANNLANYLSFFVILLFLLLCIFSSVLDDESDFESQFITKIIFVGAFVSFLSCRGSIMDRIAAFFIIFIPIYYVKIVNRIRDSRDRLIINLGVVIIGLAYFYTILLLRPDWNNVIPYEFFFM